MIGDTLLESSPDRAPVLQTTHWIIAWVAAAIGFLAWYFGSSIIFPPPESERAFFVQSITFGALPFLLLALMFCYVWAESRHSGFNPWVWLIVVLFLNVFGFLFYLIYSAAKTGDWKRATIPIAYILEFILIFVLVLVPLIYTQALPKAQLMTFLVAPPPPPPPPPPPAAVQPKIVRRVTVQDIMRAPTVIPKTIAVIKEEVLPPDLNTAGSSGVEGGMPGGASGRVMGNIISGLNAAPPPPKPAAPKRIRVGGQVESAKLIAQPKPDYPALAKMARIQGVVKLEAVIGKDGSIQDLKVLSGHPLLVKSAIESVSRWRYQPTLLNGEPVEVVTEIDVSFTLAE